MKTRKFGDLRDALYDENPKSRERVAEKVANLTEQLGLSELRATRARTQAQLAQAIGTSQSGVSRIERQDDLLVSTLRDYVAATGGRLRLLATYTDFESEIDLPVLRGKAAPTQNPRAFRVVWQNVETRLFVHVGWLTYDGIEFECSYTAEAQLDPDFEPFPAFPDLRETYRAKELFPFFAERIVSSATANYDDVIAALGLSRDDATPVELLARSWGKSPHDTIQVVPEPTLQPDGLTVRLFLVSGARHVDDDNPESVTARIAALQPNTPLTLRDEPDNQTNGRAILVEAAGAPVGWVPDYLLDAVHKEREAGDAVAVFVEKANGADTPWHLRLLCRLEVHSD